MSPFKLIDWRYKLVVINYAKNFPKLMSQPELLLHNKYYKGLCEDVSVIILFKFMPCCQPFSQFQNDSNEF